jgi:hypothetical protein
MKQTLNPTTNPTTNQPTSHSSDQRRESRLPADTPVHLTVLKVLGEPSCSGHVIDMSGSGLRVSVPLPVPCGAQVKVESHETVIFGEVCDCAENDGLYSIGLMVSELRPR